MSTAIVELCTNSPPQLRRGGAKRRSGLFKFDNFLNEPPRRFAAPRLNQGGELHSVYVWDRQKK